LTTYDVLESVETQLTLPTNAFPSNHDLNIVYVIAKYTRVAHILTHIDI